MIYSISETCSCDPGVFVGFCLCEDFVESIEQKVSWLSRNEINRTVATVIPVVIRAEI